MDGLTICSDERKLQTSYPRLNFPSSLLLGRSRVSTSGSRESKRRYSRGEDQARSSNRLLRIKKDAGYSIFELSLFWASRSVIPFSGFSGSVYILGVFHSFDRGLNSFLLLVGKWFARWTRYSDESKHLLFSPLVGWQLRTGRAEVMEFWNRTQEKGRVFRLREERLDLAQRHELSCYFLPSRA